MPEVVDSLDGSDGKPAKICCRDEGSMEAGRQRRCTRKVQVSSLREARSNEGADEQTAAQEGSHEEARSPPLNPGMETAKLRLSRARLTSSTAKQSSRNGSVGTTSGMRSDSSVLASASMSASGMGHTRSALCHSETRDL